MNRVSADVVKLFARNALNLIPEAQATIGKQDQRRKVGGGGRGGLKSETSPINFTASSALHDLHMLMLQILGDYEGDRHVYRNPLDAAKAVHDGYLSIASLPRIDMQLYEGWKLLDILTREIDLPPDPIPLGECECGEPMVAVEGQEVVECRRCETPWEVDERRANRRNRIINTIKRPVTPPQAAAILEQCGVNISRKTINKWAERGKLKMEDGRVSVSDIIDVAANSRPGRPSAVDI